jgi:hypothetical protein
VSTDSARIARLEAQVADLRDDLLKLRGEVNEWADNLDAVDYIASKNHVELLRRVLRRVEALEAQRSEFTPADARATFCEVHASRTCAVAGQAHNAGMNRALALTALLAALAALLGLADAPGRSRVVMHEELFPNHAVKPAGVEVKARRRLGPPPPGHPRIVGDVRPDGGVSAETVGYPFAWEFIGPSVIDSEYWSGNAKASGRITAIAPHPSNANTCWISTDGGGVWRTIDGGASWKPLTDTLPSLRGGALAVHPDNPNILFWGTGDFRVKTTGAGLFRSGDGGESWELVSPSSSVGLQISGISHSGGVPGVLHVAGSSGVRRSTDGGTSWSSRITGIGTSLWAGPGATQLYAGMRSDGVYRSIDGGVNWTKCTSTSFPTSGTFTVVTVGACRASPNTVFAAFVGASASYVTRLYRSTDGGVNWTRCDLNGTGRNTGLSFETAQPGVLTTTP